MTEKQRWMVHPRSGLAHYTRLSLDPAFSQMTICKLEVDGSWSPMKGPERKCRKCKLSIKMDNAITLEEKTNLLKDYYMNGAKNGKLKE